MSSFVSPGSDNSNNNNNTNGGGARQGGGESQRVINALLVGFQTPISGRSPGDLQPLFTPPVSGVGWGVGGGRGAAETLFQGRFKVVLTDEPL